MPVSSRLDTRYIDIVRFLESNHYSVALFNIKEYSREEMIVASKLTPKQQRFVDEYLIDLNATQAAIRAGYSPKTANRIAAENLSKPVIQAAIQQRQKKNETKLEISQERIIRELASIAFANGADFAEVIELGGLQTVEFKATKDLPAEKRAAIASIKSGSSGMEVKTYDKLKAMELLGKYLGYLNPAGDTAKATSLADAIMEAYTQRKEDNKE